MAWSTVILGDLDGASIGEISNPRDRTLSWRVRRVATSTFSLDLDDPLADRVLAGDVLVKQYEDDVLRFVGEATDFEEVVDGDGKKLVKATFQDVVSRLAGRLVGKSAGGYSRPAGVTIDLGGVISELMGILNAESDTGIRMGSVIASTNKPVGPYQYKPMMEVLAELSATLDGYDWRLDPVEPAVDAIGLALGTLNLGPSFGQRQPNAVFAYSDDKADRGNVKSYTRTIAKSGLLNRAFVLPSGFPDAEAGSVTQWDDDASKAQWRLREAVIPSDLTVPELRLALAQQHVIVRRQPRQLITFSGFARSDTEEKGIIAGQPLPVTPRFRRDYDLGDTVPFRATVNGKTRVNATFRVYGADLAIDDEGTETPTLSLIPED